MRTKRREKQTVEVTAMVIPSVAVEKKDVLNIPFSD